jgi:uncharacterized protein YsxB (DUF464 family)
MIDVQFKRKRDSLVLRVKGHSYSAEPGKDIICASASTLAYTLAQLCMDNEDKQTKKPIIRLEKGDAEIICSPKSECIEEMLGYYRFAREGYVLLEFNYPQYVKVKGETK